ncbi:hypothetical protein J1605_017439 [Eschrichtius robustus]|uniref:Uncharacterized protein n=1 Tax=Eschrichtius robustus TaxID=9764 RepID=A0AB34I287_ESCRO|nr:hypothetical protein J1605_017439 [Eschrichtius robustus]
MTLNGEAVSDLDLKQMEALFSEKSVELTLIARPDTKATLCSSWSDSDLFSRDQKGLLPPPNQSQLLEEFLDNFKKDTANALQGPVSGGNETLAEDPVTFDFVPFIRDLDKEVRALIFPLHLLWAVCFLVRSVSSDVTDPPRGEVEVLAVERGRDSSQQPRSAAVDTVKLGFLVLCHLQDSAGALLMAKLAYVFVTFHADFSNVPDITTGLKRSQTDGTLDQVSHREKKEQTFRANAKATLKKLGSLFKASVAVRRWRRWQLWGDRSPFPSCFSWAKEEVVMARHLRSHTVGKEEAEAPSGSGGSRPRAAVPSGPGR